MALVTNNLYVSGNVSSLNVTGAIKPSGGIVLEDADMKLSQINDGTLLECITLDAGDGTATVVVNEGGSNIVDFRVESDKEDEALFLDASQNSFYINKGENDFTASFHNDDDVVMTIGPGGAIFNQDSNANVDFRIETDGEDEAFFIDSSANTIYINKGNTAFETIIESTNAQALNVDSTGVVINEEANGSNNFRVEATSNTHAFYVQAGVSGGKMGFLDSAAGVTTFGSIGRVQVQTDFTNNYGFYVKHHGDNTNRRGIRIDCGTTGSSGTNTAMSFRDGDGTEIGNITFTGSTVSYNQFTGGHFGTVEDEDARNYGILLKVDSIEKTNRHIHYNMSMTTSANDRAVIGVYSGELEDMDGSISHQVYAVGDGNILVCSEGGNISTGDYICSSNVAGHGMKQSDDLLHNYTVAKALEAVDWSQESETTKLIACTYHAG